MKTFLLILLGMFLCGVLVCTGIAISRWRERRMIRARHAEIDANIDKMMDENPEGFDRLKQAIEQQQPHRAQVIIITGVAGFAKLMADQERDAATRPERWESGLN